MQTAGRLRRPPLIARTLGPQRYFNDAQIRCARFEGKSKVNFLDQLDVEGTVLEAIDEVPKFIRRNTRMAGKIEGMRREDTPEYPAVALREGLVNAVAHADYSKRGMQIMVAIYSDRMEIQNPGILPLGMTVEDIKDGVSRIRNPVIARVLRELDLMETWGSGYRRITEDCDQGGYPYPEWNELGSVVRITFPPHPDVSKGARPVGIGEHEDVQISVPINVQLNERQRWFLLNLQKGNQVRPINIATRFEVSEKTARRDVKRLREHEVVEYVGSRKTGHYQLKGTDE